ncbi:unnamed protein product, partial [Darwinula stevensoni]
LQLTFIDIVVYVSLKASGHWCIRWSRILRPLFLIDVPEGRQIRRAVRNIRQTLPDVLNVLFLFFFSIAAFALMAYKLFAERGLKYPNGDPYFPDYGESIWELYVLVTTANNPDVMLPVYEQNAWFAIFFAGFLIVCLYILANVFLAVVYNNFRQHLKEEVRSAVFLKRQHLAQAFDILKDPLHCGIDKETFQSWLKECLSILAVAYFGCKVRGGGAENREEVKNPTRVISDLKEFLQLADLLNVQLSQVKDNRNFQERYYPKIYRSSCSLWLREFVLSKPFLYIMDAMIIANAVLIALDLDECDWFFLPVFCLEILLKVYASGTKNFFKQFWNVFDFLIIGSALLLILFQAAMHGMEESVAILEVLLVLRVLRLVKIIGTIDRFKVVVTTIVNLTPAISTYGAIVFVLFYFYAILGMELFGGLVEFPSSVNGTDCGNPRLRGVQSDIHSHYLKKWDFLTDFINEVGMYPDTRSHRDHVQHIQSVWIAYVERVVHIGYHPAFEVITSGYVLMTSKWARLYFLSFHISCVLIVLNIFTAFVLEAFILEYTMSDERLQWDMEDKLRNIDLVVDKYVSP